LCVREIELWWVEAGIAVAQPVDHVPQGPAVLVVLHAPVVEADAIEVTGPAWIDQVGLAVHVVDPEPLPGVGTERTIHAVGFTPRRDDELPAVPAKLVTLVAGDCLPGVGDDD